MANIALRRSNEPTTSNVPTWGGWAPSRLFENFLGWDPFREMYPSLAATPATCLIRIAVNDAGGQRAPVHLVPGGEGRSGFGE